MSRFPTYAAEEEIRARGVETLPLHGTPSPALPAHVVEAVARALSEPMRTPPARGLEPLLEALAAELEASTGRAVDPASELVVTNGAMHALGVVFRALLAPGDEVVVPAPCFFFETPIQQGGGSPVIVTSTSRNRWGWDAEEIEAAITARARVLLLCNPENPTGHVPSRDEIAEVVEVAERRSLLVVTDEAYEASLWEGASLASAFGVAERAIVVRSLGKSLAMPHLRLGLLAGPADLVARCAERLEWDCLRVGIAAQTAALAALAGSRAWLESVQAQLTRDRAAALEVVAGVDGLRVVPPRGGPFLFLETGDGRSTLADELVGQGLPVIDGRHFQAPGHARLPFGGAEACRGQLEHALASWAMARG